MKNLLYFLIGFIFCLLLNLLLIYPSITRTAYNFGSREGIKEYEKHLEEEYDYKDQLNNNEPQTNLGS